MWPNNAGFVAGLHVSLGDGNGRRLGGWFPVDLVTKPAPFTVLFDSMEETTVVVTEVAAWLKKLATPIALAGINGGQVIVHRVGELRHGRGMRYHVRMELTTAGTPITIGHNKLDIPPHEDVYVAIRDAFCALRRRLN